MDCKELGIIDEIVPEPEGGAHTDPEAAAQELGLAIVRQLAGLAKTNPKKLVKTRYEKFRNMGEYTSHSKEAVRREVSLLQHIVLKKPVEKKGKSKKKPRWDSSEAVPMAGND
jgi:hypothetical protein